MVLINKLRYELSVLRARLGISQSRFAEMLGISRQTYNAIESGKKDMMRITFLEPV